MKALIVRTSSLGDVVQTFGVADFLKSHRGTCVGWAVESRAASLVRSHPSVDHVIEINSPRLRSLFPRWETIKEWNRQKTAIQEQQWDVVFDLQGNCKSGIVTYLTKASDKVGYGKQTVAELPNLVATNFTVNPPVDLPVRERYLWVVREYLRDFSPFSPRPVELILSARQEKILVTELCRWPRNSPVWIVALGSRWPSKMCRFDTLIQLLMLIQDAYGPYFIFLASSAEELNEVGAMAQYFSHASHVIFRQDLEVLQRLLGRAQAVVAVDSLILHLASTTSVPTFGIFGPSYAHCYMPQGPRFGFFQGQCPQYSTFDKRCPDLRVCSHGHCLKDIDPQVMFSAIERWQSECPSSLL